MAPPLLRKLEGKGETLTRLQDEVTETFARSLPPWLRRGVLQLDVALTASNANRVVHKLRKAPRVLIMNVREATSSTFDQIVVVSSAADAVVLNSANACTVDIWFYLV